MLQLASSNLHKRYMVKKASQIVITCLMPNGVILIKNNLLEVMPEHLFQVWNLTLDSGFNAKWGHRTKKSLYLPYYWS